MLLNERNLKLIQAIQARKDTFSRFVDMSILGKIDRLIKWVRKEDVVIADKNSSTYIFGTKEFLSYFCELFDPVLAELVPVESLAWKEMGMLGTPFPLSDHLEKSNLRQVADNLRFISGSVVYYFNPEINDWDQTIAQSESIGAVYELMDAILEILPMESMRWCEVCFRRSLPRRKLCDIHSIGQSKKNGNEENIPLQSRKKDKTQSNTLYQKAKKILHTMDAKMIMDFEMYKTRRRMLKDGVVILSGGSGYMASFKSNIPFHDNSSEGYNLVERTTYLPWKEIATDWDSFISQNYVACKKIITKSANDFTTWELYARYVLDQLGDKFENTNSPIWLVNIIHFAEVWINAEANVKDGRLTGTEQTIIEFYTLEKADAPEIARRLSISPSRVYQVLRFNLIPLRTSR